MADKLSEYNSHLETLGERNSYSKTDKEATFMRMKEDAMNNGQTSFLCSIQKKAEIFGSHSKPCVEKLA